MRLSHGFSFTTLLLCAGPIAAAPITTIAAEPIALPTMFTPLPQSMQQLIGDGYQVVNIAIGLSGFGYLLKHETRYVTCAVQPDQTRTGQFKSECRAMN